MGVGDWIGDRWDDVEGGIESFVQSSIKRADGFWDAGWELGKAPVNYGWDFVQATKDLVDDNDVGVADWLHQVAWEDTKEAFGQSIGATIGPEGIGGNIVEMMPGFVRSGGNDLLKGIEWAGREGIREPLAALVTVASLMEADGRGNDLSAWLDIDDYWDQAYEIAQTRSIGQAITLAFASSEEKSILDEQAVAGWMDTTWFNVTSGTIDVAMRMFAEPDMLLFGVGMYARAGHRVRQFNNYFNESGKFTNFSNDVARISDDILRNPRRLDDEVARIDDSVDMLTGRIREKYFAKHAEGDLISREIALAHMGQEGFAGGPESVKNVMQFFMGDVTAIRRIALENPVRGFDYGVLLKDWTHPALAAVPGRVGGSADEFLSAQRRHDEAMDAIEDGILSKDPDALAEFTGGANVVPGWASIDVVIRPTRRINLQDKVRHSGWYRPEGGGANRFVRTIQLFRDMKPQHHIFAGDANAADNVARVMKESNLFSAEEIVRFRGDWASRGVNSRVALAEKVQRDVVERILRKNIPQDEWLRANPGRSAKEYNSFVQLFVDDFRASNLAAKNVFQKARNYDYGDVVRGNQGSEFKFIDEGGEVLMQSPLTPSQLKTSFFTVDARRLNRHVARAVRRTRRRTDDVIESGKIPEVSLGDSPFQAIGEGVGYAAKGITDYWRPAVLLRPAWAVRVVGDEQLRLFAKLQTLSGEGSGLWGLLTSNRRAYVESVFQRYALKNADEGANFLRQAERELKKLNRRRAYRAGALGGVLGGAPGAILFGGGSFLRNRRAYREMLRRSTRDGGFVRPHEGQLHTREYDTRNIVSRRVLSGRPFARRRGPEKPLSAGEYPVQGPFGTHESPNLVMRESVSSQRQAGHALSHNARNTERNLRTGDWNRTSSPRATTVDEQKQFTQDWERVVNDQWNGTRSRPMAQILFDDVTYASDIAKREALLEWYSTPAGKSFLKGKRVDLDDPDLEVLLEELIDIQIAATNRMVNPAHDVGQVIRQRLVKGERVSANDLKNYVRGEPEISDEAVNLLKKDAASKKKLVEIENSALPAAPGVIDEPRWHGSSSLFNEFSTEGSSAKNLFGEGVYTTDSLDTAVSYAKPKKTTEYPHLFPEETSSRNIYNVVWKGDNPPRIVDIEAPMPRNVRESFEKRNFADEFDDISVETSEALRNVLKNPESSYQDFYEVLRKAMRETEYPAYEFDSLIYVINQTLQEAGVDGLRHTGGLRTGSKKLHEVTIWLDPEKVAINEAGDISGLLSKKARAEIEPLPSAQLHEFVGDVHAQEIDSLAGLSPIKQKTRDFVDNAYQRIAGLTTDNLSRNPYFATVYRRSMERRIKAATSGQTGERLAISEDALRILENAARKEGLQEVRWLMYDLAESSRFADMTRMIMPFYNAWQEVLTRWMGLAFENPVFAARMKQVLTANPNVDLGTLGAYETVQDADGNSFFQVRLPDFATGLLKEGLIGGAADDLGIIRFRTSSLNMITQGLPGFGPVAQIPASAFLEEAPEFEEAMSFMLPYGPADYTDFLPAWAKRVYSAVWEDDSFDYTAAQILITRVADMANGKTDIIDFDDNSTRAQFLKEIETAARHANIIRAIGSAVSPASFNLHSPYQEYIDIYRKMKAEDAANADDNFLAFLLEEGDEGFFALTIRQSRNMEGLPPTLWAEQQRDKYEELIIDHPDLGGLIIGVEGGGASKFSAVIHNRQSNEETFPGSGVMRREDLSLDEMLTDSRVRAGWEAYGDLMDWVYGKLREEGHANLRVSGAAAIRQFRDDKLAEIAEEFPLWHDEFSSPDTTKWADRIKGMRRIVDLYVSREKNEATCDEDGSNCELWFEGREDIEQLRIYLGARGSVERALAARKAAGGSGQLDSSSNQDIAGEWDTWRLDWADNIAAGDLFFRWFEFDSVKQDTWAE